MLEGQRVLPWLGGHCDLGRVSRTRVLVVCAAPSRRGIDSLEKVGFYPPRGRIGV